jgi:hypothetical protein
MSEVKNLQEAVAEVKKAAKTGVNVEKTLLDEFAMSIATGLISTNRSKNVADVSYELANEMMEARKQYLK